MLKILFLSLWAAFGNTGVVEKTQGTKAIVIFEKGAPEKGTRLVPETLDEFSELEDEFNGSSSRKSRQNSLNWKLRIDSQNYEIEGAYKTSYSGYGGAAALAYGYNWGPAEAAVGISHQNSGSSNLLGIGLSVTANLIENKPGNDLIPNLGVSLNTLNGKDGGIEYSGTEVDFGLGLQFFPLSEILAVNLNLIFPNLQLNYKTSPEIKTKVTGTTISTGWSLYF